MTLWLLFPKSTCPPFPSKPSPQSFLSTFMLTITYSPSFSTSCIVRQHVTHHTWILEKWRKGLSFCNGAECSYKIRSDVQLLLHLCASNKVKCGLYTQLVMSKSNSNRCFWFIYRTMKRSVRLVPNLPTRSRLAISAALTPSAAFVPARITAERRKKAKMSPRECSLNNRKNVTWMMQTLWSGPWGLCWPVS